MSENTFSFMRMTRALEVPVSATASNYTVPAGFITPDHTAVIVTNANQCWVNVRATIDAVPPPTTADLAGTDGDDTLLPPGFVGVFTTVRPLFLSAIALDMPGYPIAGLTFQPIRIAYGAGT